MNKFPWGKVVEVHKFKGHEIVEYYANLHVDGRQVRGEYENKTSFHTEFCSETFPTYDVAVIGILCKEYQGLNHHLTYPIARMLEMIKNNQ